MYREWRKVLGHRRQPHAPYMPYGQLRSHHEQKEDMQALEDERMHLEVWRAEDLVYVNKEKVSVY